MNKTDRQWLIESIRQEVVKSPQITGVNWMQIHYTPVPWIFKRRPWLWPWARIYKITLHETKSSPFRYRIELP